MVVLHTGTNDLKSNQNPLAKVITNLAKNVKISGMEVSISPWIPRGYWLSKKGKKLTKSYNKNAP